MIKGFKILSPLIRIAPYILKRVLIFIPTLIIISLLSFLISVNAPGDPVAKIVTSMGQDGTASQNSDANERTKQKVRKQLGLDKPLFYFSIGTLADCDTLYKILDKQERDAAQSLTRDLGDWNLVSNFYQALKITLLKVKLDLPDSSLTVNQLSAKSQLIFELTKLKLANSNENLLKGYKSVKSWTDSLGSFKLVELDEALTEISKNKSEWVKYVPSIIWYGLNNQYHHWLLGDIGLEANVDTIANATVSNNLFTFDEFSFIERDGFWQEFKVDAFNNDTTFNNKFSVIEDINFYNNGRWISAESSNNGNYNVYVDRGRKGVVRGDFGISYVDGLYVQDKIWSGFRVSFWLIFFSIILSYIVSIPVGIFAASKKGGRFDRWSTVVLFSLYSLPSFFIATILLYTFANPDFFVWFPESGINNAEVFDESWGFWKKIKHQVPYYILPLITYTYSSFAFLSRIMRTGMVDVLGQDFVRTARAKGLNQRKVILKHVLKNALLPIITVFANIFPAAVGGSVILESIFGIPGMGKLGYEAILNLDYPVILAVFTISGGLTVLGYLVSDILYAVVDPRISLNR